MDTRRRRRIFLLAAALLAACAGADDRAPATCNLLAPVRDGLRLITQLIRVQAPEAPAQVAITTGVRG